MAFQAQHFVRMQFTLRLATHEAGELNHIEMLDTWDIDAVKKWILLLYGFLLSFVICEACFTLCTLPNHTLTGFNSDDEIYQ